MRCEQFWRSRFFREQGSFRWSYINIIKERAAVIGKICPKKPILFDFRTARVTRIIRTSLKALIIGAFRIVVLARLIPCVVLRTKNHLKINALRSEIFWLTNICQRQENAEDSILIRSRRLTNWWRIFVAKKLVWIIFVTLEQAARRRRNRPSPVGEGVTKWRMRCFNKILFFERSEKNFQKVLNNKSIAMLDYAKIDLILVLNESCLIF